MEQNSKKKSFDKAKQRTNHQNRPGCKNTTWAISKDFFGSLEHYRSTKLTWVNPENGR